jgi:hypothetical protein
LLDGETGNKEGHHRLDSEAKPGSLTAFAAYVAAQNNKRVEVDQAAGVKEY